MRKKFTAIVLSTILAVSISLSAVATNNFNLGIFDNREDVTVKYDDMSNSTSVYATSLINGEGNIKLDWNYDYVSIYPHVAILKSVDSYIWCIDYNARNWMFIDTITIKIGNKRYIFKDFLSTKKVYSDSTIVEHMTFVITNDTIPFMQDLITHRNEPIKVRLSGETDNVDFFLPDIVKDGMINIYNLYVAGGGTEPNNMKLLTNIEGTNLTIREN